MGFSGEFITENDSQWTGFKILQGISQPETVVFCLQILQIHGLPVIVQPILRYQILANCVGELGKLLTGLIEALRLVFILV